jgi:hypothetical protein
VCSHGVSLVPRSRRLRARRGPPNALRARRRGVGGEAATRLLWTLPSHAPLSGGGFGAGAVRWTQRRYRRWVGTEHTEGGAESTQTERIRSGLRRGEQLDSGLGPMRNAASYGSRQPDGVARSAGGGLGADQPCRGAESWWPWAGRLEPRRPGRASGQGVGSAGAGAARDEHGGVVSECSRVKMA